MRAAPHTTVAGWEFTEIRRARPAASSHTLAGSARSERYGPEGPLAPAGIAASARARSTASQIISRGSSFTSVTGSALPRLRQAAVTDFAVHSGSLARRGYDLVWSEASGLLDLGGGWRLCLGRRGPWTPADMLGICSHLPLVHIK